MYKATIVIGKAVMTDTLDPNRFNATEMMNKCNAIMLCWENSNTYSASFMMNEVTRRATPYASQSLVITKGPPVNTLPMLSVLINWWYLLKSSLLIYCRLGLTSSSSS